MDSAQPAVMLKFLSPGSASARNDEIKVWLGDDLVESKPLFPDADDEQLSTIFEIYLKDGIRVGDIINKLQRQSAVEYAHVPANRVANKGDATSDEDRSA